MINSYKTRIVSNWKKKMVFYIDYVNVISLHLEKKHYAM